MSGLASRPLEPVLILHELGDERHFKFFALIGLVAPVEQGDESENPKERYAQGQDHRNAQDGGQNGDENPYDDTGAQRLQGMVTLICVVLVFFDQQNEYRDDGEQGIAQSGQQFLVTGGAGANGSSDMTRSSF